MMEVFPMHRSGILDPQARAIRIRWLLGLSTAGMVMSVAMLVVSWVLSMAFLVTSSRLFEAVFALP